MEPSNPSSFSIRITSDPDTTDVTAPSTAQASERVDLPFRLLLVSDLAPHVAPDWEGASCVTSVDTHRFADYLASLSPRLEIEVPNRVSEAPKLLDVALRFASLGDFHPEQVARQVPELVPLLDLRALVDQVERKEIDLDTFRERLVASGADEAWADELYRTLSAPPAPKPSRRSSTPSHDALDRLFGMVDTGEAAPEEEASSGLVDALMGALSDPASEAPRTEQTAAAALRSELDATISAQVDALFTHDAFRRLEAAWRGLRLLVDRLDVRKGIVLDVLPAGKVHLLEALYHQVLMPEHAASDEPDHVPLSALLIDADFGYATSDIDVLTDLAETGASLQVPVIANITSDFFGVEAPTGLTKLPLLWQYLEGPQYIAWNKLRERPETAYLSLVVPPLVVRDAYGPLRPVAAFSYEETGQVWCGGALAVAVALAQSFAQTGWPTHGTGVPHGRIEDLPTWKSPGGLTPLAVLLPERKQDELRDAGFVVLSGQPDRDVITLTFAPTVHRGEGATSLAAQLFSSRVAHGLLRAQQTIATSADLEDVRQTLRTRLLRFLGDESGEAVQIDPVPEAATPDAEVLAVRVEPPSSVLDQPVHLVLGIQVPKAPASS